MKTLIRHGIRHFTDKYFESAMCYLRIYRDEVHPLHHTILLTEISRSGKDSLNASGSVIGVIEKLSTEIVRQYGIVPTCANFIVQNTLFDFPFEAVELIWNGKHFYEPRFKTIHQPEEELAQFLPEDFWKVSVIA